MDYVFEDDRQAIDMCCHEDMETEESRDIIVTVLFSNQPTITVYKISKSVSSSCLIQIRDIRLNMVHPARIACYQSCYFVAGTIFIFHCSK